MKKIEKKMQKLGQVDSNKNDIMKYACVHLGGFNTEWTSQIQVIKTNEPCSLIHIFFKFLAVQN